MEAEGRTCADVHPASAAMEDMTTVVRSCLNSHWRWRGLSVVVATPSSCRPRRGALTQIKPERPSVTPDHPRFVCALGFGSASPG